MRLSLAHHLVGAAALLQVIPTFVEASPLNFLLAEKVNGAPPGYEE